MPDSLNLRLDPETERALWTQIDEETQRGRFTLSHGSTLVLGSGKDPSQSDLVGKLRDKLDPYIDFEAGGLKLMEIEKNGTRARFTLVPSWETAPHGVRGNQFGGPSIALRFTLTW